MASDPSSFRPKLWVVRDFLLAGEVAVLVAPPATGKSAVAARLALDVRAGRPFLGHATHEGAVLFVAAEREHETRLRITAMRPGELDVPVLGPTTAGKIDLRDEKTVARIVATMNDVERTLGETMRLVVLDTLARCMPGAEENSAREMGLVADALSRIAGAGAAVLVLHHPARNGTGVRGSSAIDGAVDRVLELKVDKTGVLTLKVKEANAGPCGASVRFGLAPIEIGREDDGEPITAIAIHEIGKALHDGGVQSAEGPRASTLLRILRDAGGQLARKDLLEQLRARNAVSIKMASAAEQLRQTLRSLRADNVLDYSDSMAWLLADNPQSIAPS